MSTQAFKTIIFEEDWTAFPPGPLPADNTARGEYMCRTVPDAENGWYQAGFELNVKAQKNKDASVWRIGQNKNNRFIEQPETTAAECLILTIGERSWKDYAVKAEIRATGARAAGLIARYTTSRDFYALVLESGMVKIIRRSEGIYTVLANVKAPLAMCDATTWELRCEKNRITGEIDGEIILETCDCILASGGVGILGNGPIQAGTLIVICPTREKDRIEKKQHKSAATLIKIQKSFPQPVLVAEIGLKGHSCGRQMRFADLDGDGRAEIICSVPTTIGGGNPRIGRVSVLSLDGDVFWEHGDWPADARHLTTDLPIQAAGRKGRMEIIVVRNGELQILDPLTGKIKRRAPIPKIPDEFPFAENYNEAVSPAGKPTLVNCIRLCNGRGKGAYEDILIKDHHHHAWLINGDTLEPMWHYRCNAGHFPYTADLEGNGRDEFFLGYARLDANGKLMWKLHLGDHPDGTFAYRDEDGLSHVLHAAGDVGLVDDILPGALIV